MAGSDRCDFAQMTHGLGSEWLILGTDYKLHPSIAWSHPPIVALRRLMHEHAIKPREVVRVRVWNVGVSRIADYAPMGAVDAQFSLPFAVATTLLGEPLSPALYSDTVLRSPHVRAMLKRVECVPDAAMDQDWFQGNRMRTRVEVELSGGRTVSATAMFPGDKPVYGLEQVIEKLYAMAGGLLRESQLDKIVATVGQLEKVPDMAVLARLLCPTGRKRVATSKSARRK